MKTFGLIGYFLAHSYSKVYFQNKFTKENIFDCEYRLFSLEDLNSLMTLLENYDIKGLNVTIPYKETIIKFLDEIDPIASEIGAVNCIRIQRSKNKLLLKGFNTDVFGFEGLLKTHLQKAHKKALILGTGGSSKAVSFVLKKFGIHHLFVSRNPKSTYMIGYSDLTVNLIKEYELIINTTPLGMFPDINTFPKIPYQGLSSKHLLIDVVYNPEISRFLQMGVEKQSATVNGLEMLYFQAEESWKIWNQ